MHVPQPQWSWEQSKRMKVTAKIASSIYALPYPEWHLPRWLRSHDQPKLTCFHQPKRTRNEPIHQRWYYKKNQIEKFVKLKEDLHCVAKRKQSFTTFSVFFFHKPKIRQITCWKTLPTCGQKAFWLPMELNSASVQYPWRIQKTLGLWTPRIRQPKEHCWDANPRWWW